MIIENRWFNFQAPRRADLSGQPIGFLFIWLGGLGARSEEARSRFQPTVRPSHPRAKEFGFFIPNIVWRVRIWLQPKYEALDCSQLIDLETYVPNDWRKWPNNNRLASEAAVRRAVEERPGCKIVQDKSSCDRRIDLAGRPLQLYRSIIIKKAA